MKRAEEGKGEGRKREEEEQRGKEKREMFISNFFAHIFGAG